MHSRGLVPAEGRISVGFHADSGTAPVSHIYMEKSNDPPQFIGLEMKRKFFDFLNILEEIFEIFAYF